MLVIAVHARGEQDPFIKEITQEQGILSLLCVSTSQPGWDQNMCKKRVCRGKCVLNDIHAYRFFDFVEGFFVSTAIQGTFVEHSIFMHIYMRDELLLLLALFVRINFNF